VNSNGSFSLNLLDGSNRGYLDGSAAEREQIREHHLRYTQALLYFLALDDSVPAHIRSELVRWGQVFNEGYLSVAVPPYSISYRSLVPRRMDCENLLVPICLSASHVAFGSVRMEPTLMLLGHAAGVAAAQAARRGVAVQDVDVDVLQQTLRDAGQVLAL
jgi:hypothetical protein